jgi:hypothetical protein
LSNGFSRKIENDEAAETALRHLIPLLQQLPLQPGVRLGPYEILADVGAGGMGAV